METLTYVQTQFAYNRWANHQALAVLATLAEADLAAPCSGNGTVLQTMGHALAVEEAYMQYLTGQLPASQALARAGEGRSPGSVAELQAIWQASERLANPFMAQLTEAQLAQTAELSLPRGAATLALWQLLFQIINHGTHTRGQVCSAIRALGKNPPRLDFMYFAFIGMPVVGIEGADSV